MRIDDARFSIMVYLVRMGVMMQDELVNLCPIDEITALDTYQVEAARTAIYPPGIDIIYNCIGDLGETGEYAKVVLGAVDRTLQREAANGRPSQELMVVRHALQAAIEACATLESLKRPIREGKMALPEVRFSPDEEALAEKELGDSLWYKSGSARAIGLPLSRVAQTNIAKLRARMAEGVLHSSGETIEERKRGRV